MVDQAKGHESPHFPPLFLYTISWQVIVAQTMYPPTSSKVCQGAVHVRMLFEVESTLDNQLSLDTPCC